MQLYIYKKGQGYYTRLWGSLACFAICAIGCYTLHTKLAAVSANPWINSFVPAVVLGLLTYVVYWVQNKPAIADFLIASEGELKKVSWSSKAEITASTTIVIFVVIFMAVLLGVVDLLFFKTFSTIGLY